VCWVHSAYQALACAVEVRDAAREDMGQRDSQPGLVKSAMEYATAWRNFDTAERLVACDAVVEEFKSGDTRSVANFATKVRPKEHGQAEDILFYASSIHSEEETRGLVRRPRSWDEDADMLRLEATTTEATNVILDLLPLLFERNKREGPAPSAMPRVFGALVMSCSTYRNDVAASQPTTTTPQRLLSGLTLKAQPYEMWVNLREAVENKTLEDLMTEQINAATVSEPDVYEDPAKKTPNPHVSKYAEALSERNGWVKAALDGGTLVSEVHKRVVALPTVLIMRIAWTVEKTTRAALQKVQANLRNKAVLPLELYGTECGNKQIRYFLSAVVIYQAANWGDGGGESGMVDLDGTHYVMVGRKTETEPWMRVDDAPPEAVKVAEAKHDEANVEAQVLHVSNSSLTLRRNDRVTHAVYSRATAPSEAALEALNTLRTAAAVHDTHRKQIEREKTVPEFVADPPLPRWPTSAGSPAALWAYAPPDWLRSEHCQRALLTAMGGETIPDADFERLLETWLAPGLYDPPAQAKVDKLNTEVVASLKSRLANERARQS